MKEGWGAFKIVRGKPIGTRLLGSQGVDVRTILE